MFIIFNNLKTIEYSFTIYISNNTTYLNMGIIVRNECINVHCYRPTFLVLSFLVEFANINVQQIGKHLDGKESLRPLLLENIIMEKSGKIKHSLWIYTKFESTLGTAPYNTLHRHLAPFEELITYYTHNKLGSNFLSESNKVLWANDVKIENSSVKFKNTR